MPSDFVSRLRAMAGVVVDIGLNLQPSQPLIITDPYELQGVHPEALPLAEAVRELVGDRTVIMQADTGRLRALAQAGDKRGYESLIADHTARLRQHLSRGGAFLFLTGSHPGLFNGSTATTIDRFDAIKWRHLGPIIQSLIRGASQWTLVPAPTTPWANLAFADLAENDRLPALWGTVFDNLRLDAGNPATAWKTHLATLAQRRDELNAARHRTIRYTGRDTDLTLALPRSHLWHTAQLASKRGVTYVVNLPTEEIFTAPHQESAEGRLRVERPIVHAGAIIDGITLEFMNGRVVSGQARTGHDLLQQLLRTDDGARRVGEVAIVPGRNRLNLAGRLFHNPILDENACNHIALGDAYRFCSRAWLPLALNSSRIHVDLPLDATVELS